MNSDKLKLVFLVLCISFSPNSNSRNPGLKKTLDEIFFQKTYNVNKEFFYAENFKAYKKNLFIVIKPFTKEK